MPDLTDSTPAELIRTYILTRIPPAELTGWAWSIGKLPATPDQVICLVDQGGPAGIPNLLVDFPGLQVLIRSSPGGEGYRTSRLMMNKVRDAILGMPNHPIQFPELDGVTERGHVAPMGYDDKDRHIWSDNFQMIVEPEANAISHRASL